MSDLTDEAIIAKAIIEAKARKKEIAISHVDHLPREEEAVSVFMAGSPGAGKTETARRIIKDFSVESDQNLVHIENDELRKEFEDYDGQNSPLFQRPATLLVEAIHDRALKQGVSFILDSTLSSLEKAKSNIERSLKRDRYVLIIFVYQSPEQAWKFVKARETTEGRRVPEAVFVEQFLGAQVVVSQLKKYFGDRVNLTFIEKNIDGKNDRPHFNVTDVDALFRKKYNRIMLEDIIQKDK